MLVNIWCQVFARGKTQNETWIPLVEKAFAKLLGSYGHIQAKKGWEN